MYERDLTPEEIEERKTLNLALQAECDENVAEVSDKRKQIRALNVARKKLELESAEIRREIRTRKVFESRQGVLALDQPAPPLGSWSALTGEPRHGEGPLLEPVDLRYLIACVRPPEMVPTIKQVKSWHEQVRADVQRWCRVEHTRAAPIAGLALPAAYPMPSVLENIVFERDASIRKDKAAKRKAGKRKATAKRGRKASAPRGLRL